MGMPINQQRSAQDILRDFMCGTDRTISEDDLRATGVDVDILEATYETNIKPLLSYLDGYKPLEELSPFKKAHYAEPEHRWHVALQNYGQFERHGQVLVVDHSTMYWYHGDSSELPNNIEVWTYLTRKGTWLYWYGVYAQNGRGDLGDQRVRAFSTVRAMWDDLHQLVVDSYGIISSGTRFLPLRIEHGLRSILETTIANRQRRLESMQAASQDAIKRVSIVSKR